MTGQVKFFNPTSGYGFIISEENEGDIFFRRKDVRYGVLLEDGDFVEFEIKMTPRGIRAVGVEKTANPEGAFLHQKNDGHSQKQTPWQDRLVQARDFDQRKVNAKLCKIGDWLHKPANN